MGFTRFSKLLRINRTVKGGGRGKTFVLPKEGSYRPQLTYMKQKEFNQEFFTDLRGSGKRLRR